jgi:hypothetical protein
VQLNLDTCSSCNNSSEVISYCVNLEMCNVNFIITACL